MSLPVPPRYVENTSALPATSSLATKASEPRASAADERAIGHRCAGRVQLDDEGIGAGSLETGARDRVVVGERRDVGRAGDIGVTGAVERDAEGEIVAVAAEIG